MTHDKIVNYTCNTSLCELVTIYRAGSCEYQQVSEEQMALAADTGDCRKGGMRCERKCEARAGAEECREVLVDVCEDQPEEACDTVMEKHCRTVQEETCEDEPSKTQTV